MDFNKYVFIMARCCTTTVPTRGHRRPDGVYWHLVLILLRFQGRDPYSLAAGIGGQI